MSSLQTLPGFKTTFTVVGATYVLLGSSMVLRGAYEAMQPFAVPEPVLSSPHFADFFHWVFVHMVVLGILLTLLGRFVVDGAAQRVVARVILALELHYTYLDLRTSDSVLGNALYRGPGTLIPPLIDVAVCLALFVLSVRGLRSAQPETGA